MTAEIAVMNKSAIALAADSASTIQSPSGFKIYNTVNKIFRLCQREAVGVMIYGNAEIMDMPWETVVKSFRAKTQDCQDATLEEVAQRFLEFVKKWVSDFPNEPRMNYVGTSSYRLLVDLVHDSLQDHEKSSGRERRKIVAEAVEKQLFRLKKMRVLDGFPTDYPRTIKKKYAAAIKNAVHQSMMIANHSLSKAQVKMLYDLCAEQFHRDYFITYSGIVIAGFGIEEVFPSLTSFEIDGMAEKGLLKFRPGKTASTGFHNNGSITPFAQSEMVVTFMEGLDPEFERFLVSAFSDVLDEFERAVIGALGQSDVSEAFRSKLHDAKTKIVERLWKGVSTYQWKRHVSPVMSAVSALPKDELAVLAESLINITALKRRVSPDAETVGGAIDVAVISKGDGFIWIKQKHYFSRNLNPRYTGHIELISQPDQST